VEFSQSVKDASADLSEKVSYLWFARSCQRELSSELDSREATHGNLPTEHLFTNVNGDKMGNLELAGTVKMLQGQRVQVQKELAKLDKAIAVLRELSGTSSAPTQNGKRRILSAAARRKIGKAQKLRWARLKQQAGKK
jgi:hypothetical protein